MPSITVVVTGMRELASESEKLVYQTRKKPSQEE